MVIATMHLTAMMIRFVTSATTITEITTGLIMNGIYHSIKPETSDFLKPYRFGLSKM